MEQHGHPVLTVGIFLGAGVATGVVSEQDLDLKLAIALKIISIISFLVATCYALWKWRADWIMHNTVSEVMDDYQEKKKQKAKKED